MFTISQSYKKEAILLRKKGMSYNEIQKKLNLKIPKSTLSYWLKNINLNKKHQVRINNLIKNGGKKGRLKSIETKKAKKEKNIKIIRDKVKNLPTLINKNKEIAKIALVMLYLGEGSKRGSSLTFGNSNPDVISLFLKLIREVYDLDEKKFRCTLQCRADQDIKKLERFWKKITRIPNSQFYKAQIDPRTKTSRTLKKDYKGVCRIDYFSKDIFDEIMQSIDIISKGP